MTSINGVNFALRERIKAILQDAYIRKCIGKADFPANMIEMLEILFAHSSFDEEKKERLGVAAVLLQLGLEMHAQAFEQDQAESAVLKTCQQLVLAGDYYSSLFYRFLVQNRDYSLVNYFCQQILVINEAKLSLHVHLRKQREYDAEMLANHRKVTSGLLLAVADYFQHQDDFIFLWKKTVSLSLLLSDLKKSGVWADFPLSLKHQLYQEWNAIRFEIDLLKAKPKQQLLSLLTDFEDMFEKLAMKES